MLLHLLLHLMAKGRKQKVAASSPAPQRTIPDGEMVIDCPYCHKLQVAEHFDLQEGDASGREMAWNKVGGAFRCPGCRHIMDSDQFENDGGGILRQKKWKCPACASENMAVFFRCQTCGKL